MQPNVDQGALLEAFRRRSNLAPASTAGLPVGGNLNPQAQIPQQIMTQGQGQSPQPPATMSQPGIDQMNKSLPNESQIILKALIQRLRSLGDRGQ